MTNLTSHDEEALLTATKRAGDLVESEGLTPDAAIEKIAREAKFGPGEIRMLAFAHNTGRQVAQFQKSASILDKLAEFPLADPDKIIAAIYPHRTTVKAAADGHAAYTGPAPTGRHIDYLMPPTWADQTGPTPLEKAALDLPPLPKYEPPPGDGTDAMRKKYGDFERVKLAYETARQDVLVAEQELYRHVAAVTGYFQQPGRLPFATVEKVARTLHGEPATTLLTAVHQRLKSKEKRAADVPDAVLAYTVRTDMPVFGHLSACIAAGRLLGEKRAALQEKGDAFAKAKEGVSGPFAAGRPGAAPSRPTSESEKQAFLTSPAMGTFLGSSVGRIVGDGPKTKNELIEDEWLDLEDPKHQNELRKIKAHSMLNGMLTDPDNPVSGHDPDDVISAYNQISQLAPRVAEQPAAVGPLLARKLQGNVQPFEAKEITDIEKGITATRNSTPNTSLLKDAPDSLLG